MSSNYSISSSTKVPPEVWTEVWTLGASESLYDATIVARIDLVALHR